MLDLVAEAHKEVGAKPFVVTGREEVVEAHEAESKVLCPRVVEAGEEKLEDGDEVRLQSSNGKAAGDALEQIKAVRLVGL